MSSRYSDCRGLAVTASCAGAVAAYDLFVRRFLAHGADAAARLKATMEADPGLVLGHCARGFCALILGRYELRKAAREALAAARQSLAERGGTERERLYVAALATFCDGSFTGAAGILDQVLDADPLDAYAAKLVHAIRFMAGDPSGMLRSTARLLPAWTEQVPDAGYVLGCHAFGLEETGDCAAAESCGRRAVALGRDDAWALHAVAHVLEMRDQPEAGVAWLDSGAADLSRTGNLAFHVAWHKALFLLELGEIDRVLEIYDREVRAQQTDDFRDISNGVSLLARLEGEGVDVGDRWDELIDKAARRTADTALVFAALHYLAALLAGRRWREVEDQLAAMEQAAAGDGDQARLFASVGLPFARALAESWRTGHGKPALALAELLPRIAAIGGSHAQRDVFFRMTVDRLEAAGQTAAARDLLRGRLVRRPGNRWGRSRLARLAAVAPQAA